MYFAYVALQDSNGAVALFSENCTEMFHRTFDNKVDRESKYNAWFTGFNVLLSCLRDSLMRKELSEESVVRINVPVYVFYKWLTGTQAPLKYAQQVEDLVARMHRLPCNIELTPIIGGERTNRAMPYCFKEEVYTHIDDEFFSDGGND